MAVAPSADPFRDDPLSSPLLHDRGVERRLVGWLLLKPERAAEALYRVRPEHFHDRVAGAVVTAVRALCERREVPHLHAVLAELRLQRNEDVTPADVARLIDGLATGRWEDLATRVIDAHRRRTTWYALRAAQDQLTVDPDFGAVRDGVYKLLDAAEDVEHPAEHDAWDELTTALSPLFDADRRPRPIPTGIGRLDALLGGGVLRGGLTIIGARTSIGKTALAATVATHMSGAGAPVSFMSLEMTRERMAVRLAALATGVPAARWRAGDVGDDEIARLAQQRPLCVDTRARTLGAIRARAFQHRRVMGGLDVLIVDYLQLVHLQLERGQKRYEGLGQVSVGLMELAQDLNCAVFALSQLSRESAMKPEPEVSDLRESGNLEQDAEMVWLLYYPRDKAGRPIAGARPVLKVGKNRNGPVGKVGLEFDAEMMRFTDRDHEEEPARREPRRGRALKPAPPVSDDDRSFYGD